MKIFDLDKLWSYTIMSVVSFLEPINALILWLLIFILADMITGVWASMKEGKIITSHGLQKTVTKFLMYSVSIILLQGIDFYMLTFAECFLAKIGCTIICGIELYSIFENCYRITGNKVFKVLTQFTLKKIKEKTGVSINAQKRTRYK